MRYVFAFANGKSSCCKLRNVNVDGVSYALLPNGMAVSVSTRVGSYQMCLFAVFVKSWVYRLNCRLFRTIAKYASTGSKYRQSHTAQIILNR